MSRFNVPILTLLLSLFSTSCSETNPPETKTRETESPAPPEYPVPDDPALALGRGIWIENCETCHGPGKAGAPRFGDTAAWAKRVAKPLDELVKNAIQGFEGKAGYEMPAKGGNPDLTDQQVTSAVHYMVRHSK